MTLGSNLPQILPCLLGSAAVNPSRSDTSLEAGLCAYLKGHRLLQPLTGDRVFPRKYARTNQAWPAIIYQIDDLDHFTGVCGSQGMAQATFTLGVHSPVEKDAIAVAEAIRLALQGFSGWWGCVGVASVRPLGQVDSDEFDVAGICYYERAMDYAAQIYEPIPHR